MASTIAVPPWPAPPGSRLPRPIKRAILLTDEGDSTPEANHKDDRGDDCFEFESDRTEINRIVRARLFEVESANWGSSRG